MKILRMIFLWLMIMAALVYFHDHWVGLSMQPVLEHQLADAFDMPFNIDGLKISLFPPGRITLKKIECLNPREFRRPQHFVGEGVTFFIDLPALKRKCIRIKKAHFKKFLFAVETHMNGKESRSNTFIWYHHMGLDEDDDPSMNFPKQDSPPSEQAAAEAEARGKWRVMIDRLELDDGTFVYDDLRLPKDERRWIFQNLKGFWEGFDLIPGYTSPEFREYIELEGTFGQNPPARFAGKGKCQFSDGNNFDLELSIEEGSIDEYKFLLDGLPGEVTGGRFDLRSRGICHESNLRSAHVLTLREMKFIAPTLRQKILKYPFGTVLLALESQKKIELEIDVNGYIGDPKFRFFSAFTRAFRKSLTQKAKAVLNEIKKGTTMVATEAPSHVRDGVGQIGNLLNNTFSTLNPLAVLGETQRKKDEK